MTAQAKTSFIKLQAGSMPLYALLFGGKGLDQGVE